MNDFDKCTVKKERKNGKTTIDCKLGLWGVEAPSAKMAMREAVYYFEQYKEDGEYSSILGGESVFDKLVRKEK